MDSNNLLLACSTALRPSTLPRAPVIISHKKPNSVALVRERTIPTVSMLHTTISRTERRTICNYNSHFNPTYLHDTITNL
jgi:hypothetical protein